MGFELERILYETEDFFRRAIGSPGMRAARKRRAERRWEEYGRRLKRSGYVFVGLLALLLAFSIFVRAIGLFIFGAAAGTALLFALLLLFQPTRAYRRRQVEEASGGPRQLPLDELIVRAEEGLLDRCDELPGHALGAADRIMAGLRELHPNVHGLAPDAALAGDARRLVGQHLPQLIDAYLQLPDSQRAPRSESSRRLVESLTIVGDELEHLVSQATQSRQSDFDTHSRFIESRYREDDNLRSGR
ncbi:MAG TPA: hypothetical protein VMG08_21605 [Allosphingosinicella sp.]|nr:hypothetical protein [Allosphingosinicella sp.]